jgi:hypothetical protein
MTMPTLMEKLPELCASRLLTDGSPIMLKRGVKGYWPMPEGFDVEGFNERKGISAKIKLCMEIGSMRGFDVPGADPDYVYKGE